MARKLITYFFLSLVLLLIFLSSALLAMRFAIQGREVHVPALIGRTPAEAERAANADGLVLSVENRFYSASVPEGRIVSQSPIPGATVRRGWKIRVAESLGAQRTAIPNLIGQSQHAAGINISRRGLEIGTMAMIHMPGVAPETVVAQNPQAEATEFTSPKIGLVFSAPESGPWYVMPNLTGKPVTEATAVIQKAGFKVGKIQPVTDDNSGNAAGVVVRQYPQAGQRVLEGSTISFDMKK